MPLGAFKMSPTKRRETILARNRGGKPTGLTFVPLAIVSETLSVIGSRRINNAKKAQDWKGAGQRSFPRLGAEG